MKLVTHDWLYSHYPASMECFLLLLFGTDDGIVIVCFMCFILSPEVSSRKGNLANCLGNVLTNSFRLSIGFVTMS